MVLYLIPCLYLYIVEVVARMIVYDTIPDSVLVSIVVVVAMVVVLVSLLASEHLTPASSR